jgi:hypothetical protein
MLLVLPAALPVVLLLLRGGRRWRLCVHVIAPLCRRLQLQLLLLLLLLQLSRRCLIRTVLLCCCCLRLPAHCRLPLPLLWLLLLLQLLVVVLVYIDWLIAVAAVCVLIARRGSHSAHC